MATPTNNTVPITAFAETNFGFVSSMVHGTKWGGALGKGANVTFSFAPAVSLWPSNYGGEPWNNFGSFEPHQQAGAIGALRAWENVSRVSFQQMTETATHVGEIRFAFTDYMFPGEVAHAYYPNEMFQGYDLSAQSGDVWVNGAYFYDDYTEGSFMYFALMHEIGHALGLNHSFDLPDPSQDNWFYTVMSYTASPWAQDQVTSFHPTTPMFNDLVAIQAIYGIDKTTNTGNTTYTYTDGLYWETIYDASGKDTIVYDGSDTCTISLTIGSFSELSDLIYFSGGIVTRGTVCIGPNTIIENATGGGLGDTLMGNSSANILDGRGGDDTLSGGMGRDTLMGGDGADHFLFDGALIASSRDKIVDMTHDVDHIDLDDQFFAAIGAALDASEFVMGTRARDADDYIIYNSKTGELSYDADGSGRGRAVVFATLSNKPLLLDHEDFMIV